jgi:uncharacterized protein YicC (UPF0701 family)
LAKYVACRYPETAAELWVSAALLPGAMADTLVVGAAEVSERKVAEARAKEGKSLENIVAYKYIQVEEEVTLVEDGGSSIEHDLREEMRGKTSILYIYTFKMENL